MKYLNDKQHYIDLYDLLTIKECLRIIKFWQDLYKKKDTDKKLKEIPPEEIEKGFNYYSGWQLRVAKGERYRRKAETIQEWMARDKVKQDKLDNTFPPANIICPECKAEMSVGDFKYLEDDENKPFRVLFFFECPKCKKRKGIFDNGEERVSKPDLCPKCGKEVKVSFKKKDEVLTTTTACSFCKYKNVEVDDWRKRRIECETEEKKDKELLKKHREEFCLSDKDGQEYIELIEAMEVANVVREEEMQKYDSPIYQRSLQLKKTTIVVLEKLLAENLKKARYIKLSFDKPEIGRYVIVLFTVQDSDSSRENRVSSSELEKIIKNTLEDTNWRLLSNSIMYRLGYLKGQLKGYEQEEDMLKLAGKKEETKPKPKIADAKRQKYASNNLVQLAKLIGKQEGIENIRKRRLEKEPEGFFLEASEGPYSCGICGENHPGNEIWWNLDGLRCRDCRRNTQEGVIPPLTYDSDDKVWIKEWQLQSEYGLHPATRNKLRREGLLVGRDLKRKDGAIYCTVYLVKENEKFFKKYPKKPTMKVKFVSPSNKKKK